MLLERAETRAGEVHSLPIRQIAHLASQLKLSKWRYCNSHTDVTLP